MAMTPGVIVPFRAVVAPPRFVLHHGSPNLRPAFGVLGKIRWSHSTIIAAKRITRRLEETVKADEDLDEDVRIGLNEVANQATKLMLSGDGQSIAEYLEKVDYIGDYLVKEGQLEAAKFVLVIQGMLNHKVYPEKDDLKGVYKKALERMFTLVEDSGWILTLPGSDTAVPMIDDELMPPVLQNR